MHAQQLYSLISTSDWALSETTEKVRQFKSRRELLRLRFLIRIRELAFSEEDGQDADVHDASLAAVSTGRHGLGGPAVVTNAARGPPASYRDVDPRHSYQYDSSYAVSAPSFRSSEGPASALAFNARSAPPQPASGTQAGLAGTRAAAFARPDLHRKSAAAAVPSSTQFSLAQATHAQQEAPGNPARSLDVSTAPGSTQALATARVIHLPVPIAMPVLSSTSLLAASPLPRAAHVPLHPSVYLSAPPAFASQSAPASTQVSEADAVHSSVADE